MEQKDEWLQVHTDRLPEYGIWVWAYGEGHSFEAMLNQRVEFKGGYRLDWTKRNNGTTNLVSHWRELPPPPEF